MPCLVPTEHPLGYVPGSLNAVVAEGNFVGRLFLEGAGAGDGPTASAVVADIIDVARDEFGTAFAMPVNLLESLPRADGAKHVGKSYVRLHVADRTGVLAEIAIAMRDAGVSVESFIQRSAQDGQALIALVTHEGEAGAVDAALAMLAQSSSVVSAPVRMPILGL
jgi:homoserine dehydrogenase